MASSIQEIDDLKSYQAVTAQTCIVKFTAKWCGPCRQMAPVYKAAADNHAGRVQFLEIDVDQAEEISAHEKVKGIPLFLFYHEGAKMPELSLAGSKPSQLQANMAQFFELIEAAETENRGRTIEPQVTMVSDQFAYLALDGAIESSSDESGEESGDEAREESEAGLATEEV